jgi:hypothetical protein
MINKVEISAILRRSGEMSVAMIELAREPDQA